MARVFVYGSLMSGLHNNRFLEDAEFLGPERIGGEGLALVDLGSFPGLIRSDHHDGDESYHIVGELYEVGADSLARLDRLEGVPRHYNRAEVCLGRGGYAIVYILNEGHPYDCIVEGGDWRKHLEWREKLCAE